MMDKNLKCTVPVSIAGSTIDFRLRPDRHYSRIPMDIWRKLKTALLPLPSQETCNNLAEDFTGCLGLCSADLRVKNVNLSGIPLLVTRDTFPTMGLSTLTELRLVFDFGTGSTVQVGFNIPPLDQGKNQKRRSQMEPDNSSRRAKEPRRDDRRSPERRSRLNDDRNTRQLGDRRSRNSESHNRSGIPDDRRLVHPERSRSGTSREWPDERPPINYDIERRQSPSEGRRNYVDDYDRKYIDNRQPEHFEEGRRSDFRNDAPPFDRQADFRDDRRPGPRDDQIIGHPDGFRSGYDQGPVPQKSFQGRNTLGPQISATPGFDSQGVSVREVFDDLQRFIEFQNQKLVGQGLPNSEQVKPGPSNAQKGARSKNRAAKCHVCNKWGHSPTECWKVKGKPSRAGDIVALEPNYPALSEAPAPWDDWVAGNNRNAPQKPGPFGRGRQDQAGHLHQIFEKREWAQNVLQTPLPRESPVSYY